MKQIVSQLRRRIIETSHKQRIPHLGSCLSCVDILTVLYWKILNIPSLSHPDRDRFILSKGHAMPALLQVFGMREILPQSTLDGYGADGNLFPEHPPAPKHMHGIEAATGSLGHGLSMGLGMALSARIQKQPYHVYCLLSDGECNEGSVWEAAMLAAGQNVSNLTVIVDFNNWQATGKSMEITGYYPLRGKWRAFGWDTLEVNGHDHEEIETALKISHKHPMAIIAHTVKGKGVSFMEHDNNWHYRIPTFEEVGQAKKELV